MKINTYTTTEKLHESERSIIYKAVKNDTNIPFAIKMVSKEYPTSREVGKLQFEYDIAVDFEHDGIIKMYDMEKYNHTNIMIMEYPL